MNWNGPFTLKNSKGKTRNVKCKNCKKLMMSRFMIVASMLPPTTNHQPQGAAGDTLAPKRQICTSTKYIAGHINSFQNWKHSIRVEETQKKKIWSFNANTFVKIRMYWVMVLLLTKFIATSHLVHCNIAVSVSVRVLSWRLVLKFSWF